MRNITIAMTSSIKHREVAETSALPLNYTVVSRKHYHWNAPTHAHLPYDQSKFTSRPAAAASMPTFTPRNMAIAAGAVGAAVFFFPRTAQKVSPMEYVSPTFNDPSWEIEG